MKLVCLDLEGVLVPEIWIEFAKKTGIEALKRTTRDEPDYNQLMRNRIAILKEHGLTVTDIQQVIAQMQPLTGAVDFLETLRSFTQVIILSDTFEEFARPLMEQLARPTLFCNSLIVNPQTQLIEDFVIRKKDGKRSAVEALRSINIDVFAAGDSYNDLSMIQSATAGVFFRPAPSIVKENPQIGVTGSYSQLLAAIRAFVG